MSIKTPCPDYGDGYRDYRQMVKAEKEQQPPIITQPIKAYGKTEPEEMMADIWELPWTMHELNLRLDGVKTESSSETLGTQKKTRHPFIKVCSWAQEMKFAHLEPDAGTVKAEVSSVLQPDAVIKPEISSVQQQQLSAGTVKQAAEEEDDDEIQWVATVVGNQPRPSSGTQLRPSRLDKGCKPQPDAATVKPEISSVLQPVATTVKAEISSVLQPDAATVQPDAVTVKPEVSSVLQPVATTVKAEISSVLQPDAATVQPDAVTVKPEVSSVLQPVATTVKAEISSVLQPDAATVQPDAVTVKPKVSSVLQQQLSANTNTVKQAAKEDEEIQWVATVVVNQPRSSSSRTQLGKSRLSQSCKPQAKAAAAPDEDSQWLEAPLTLPGQRSTSMRSLKRKFSNPQVTNENGDAKIKKLSAAFSISSDKTLACPESHLKLEDKKSLDLNVKPELKLDTKPHLQLKIQQIELLRIAGRYEEALTLCSQVLVHIHADDVMKQRILSLKCKCLEELKAKLAEKFQIWKDIFEDRRRKLGAIHSHTMHALQELSDTALKLDYHDEPEAWQTFLLVCKQTVVVNNHVYTMVMKRFTLQLLHKMRMSNDNNKAINICDFILDNLLCTEFESFKLNIDKAYYLFCAGKFDQSEDIIITSLNNINEMQYIELYSNVFSKMFHMACKLSLKGMRKTLDKWSEFFQQKAASDYVAHPLVTLSIMYAIVKYNAKKHNTMIMRMFGWVLSGFAGPLAVSSAATTTHTLLALQCEATFLLEHVHGSREAVQSIYLHVCDLVGIPKMKCKLEDPNIVPSFIQNILDKRPDFIKK